MGFFDRFFKKKKENIEDIEREEIEKIDESEQNKIEEEKNAQNQEIKEIELGQFEEKTEKEETKEELSKKLEEEIKKEIVEENFELEKVEDVKEIEGIEKTEEKQEPKEKKGFFASLKEKLFKSREGLFGTLKSLILGRSVIDDEMYEELEDILIQSDIGMDMTLKIVKDLEKEVKKRGIKEPKDVYEVLKEIMENYLIVENNEIEIREGELNVILVVGVNGVGKTTTIGKLASKYIKDGKKVVLGAGDTFRAAAIEQLEEWAKRSGADIVKSTQGSDPGAVVFDTIAAAEARKADIAIIDTAGRLHNKNNLMMELEKINKIIKKKIGDRNYETILVIDGTTGQNALNQAKVFNEVTNLTGFIITKLDGTAKGGIVFSISEEIKKPIKYIGVGEKIEDLRKFNSKEYIQAIFD